MARNLTRSHPMSELVRPGSFPNFDDLFRQFSLIPALRELEQASRMNVDIEETEKTYVMKAEVPGAKKEDITISIDGNIVSIKANVAEEKVDQTRNMLRSERVFGEEYRTFTLPQDVDESKAEAKMENGVLILTLPKKSGTGGTKLTIQ